MVDLPEIVFSGSTEAESRRVSRLHRDGRIKKLIPRVYTSNLAESPEGIIRRNWQRILSRLYPGALLSHRSAIEFAPTEKGNLYLTYNTRKVLRWPGLNVRMVNGPGPLEDDNPVYGELHASSLERACLENLQSSRAVDGERRTLGQEDIEEKLLQILMTRGEDGLNKLRDRAGEIGAELHLEDEFDRLNALISSLLETGPARRLRSRQAQAWSMGEPYDSGRIALFSRLVAFLKQCTFEIREADHSDPVRYRNMAFLESYFSNYIEGTKFVVEEALEVIFSGKVIENRSGDSHDILGTYEICGDLGEMSKRPASGSGFIDLLRYRHSVVLRGRPDKHPGSFKASANRAGESYFVLQEQVTGTLKEGYQLLDALEDPLARAIYMMFVVSEVHPFDDGNGRMARIMMNAELVRGHSTKLLIPTVYREDYMLNLRKLTRREDPSGFVSMMDRAHAFSHSLDDSELEYVLMQLKAANAFRESDEAGLRFSGRSGSIIPQNL